MTPEEILDEAVSLYNPSHVFALMSGGHDSLVATHVASRHSRFSGVAHINTGIGIEETRQFVRETCAAFGWPLLEYHPPVSYDEIVLKYGFPGPAAHTIIYARLKERCLRQLVREHKTGPKDRIVLVTGVRKAESDRRMGTVETVQRDGARVWVAPITYFDGAAKEAYMAEHALPRNPVVDWLHMSGECFCGAFAGSKHGSAKLELEWARAGYPAIGERIDALQEKASAAGVWCRWGTPTPQTWLNEAHGQLAIPMLCTSCTFRHIEGGLL